MTGASAGELCTGALAELDRRLTDWVPDRVGTLLFLIYDRRVLLIHKRRGHGAGRINGPGGKLEAGEAPDAGAIRETEEETGVRASGVALAAEMRFVDTEGEDWLGYVFTANDFTGDPIVTDEAIPAWFALDTLPLEHMWPDDRLWLPSVLAGERMRGDFLFREGRLLAWRMARFPEGAEHEA